jgi:hypothetical protein
MHKMMKKRQISFTLNERVETRAVTKRERRKVADVAEAPTAESIDVIPEPTPKRRTFSGLLALPPPLGRAAFLKAPFRNEVRIARLCPRPICRGFEFLHTKPTDKQHVVEVHLGGREHVKLKTYKDFVSVLIEQGLSKHFGKSVGLMGDFRKGRKFGHECFRPGMAGA